MATNLQLQSASLTPPPSKVSGLVRRGRNSMRDLWMGGLLLILIIAFGIKAPTFFSRASWLNTSNTALEVLLVALGETFVICTAGIDLSVGANLGFSAMAGAWAMSHLFSVGAGSDIGIVLVGVVAAIITAALVGALNGALIAWANVPPFVVTLGTLGMTTGLADLINNGQEISAIPTSIAHVGNLNIGGWMPIPVAFGAIITIICALILAKTRFGAHTLSLGDSRESVIRSGINDKRHIFKVYVLAGVLAGIAGVIVMGRLGAASPTSGSSDNLSAIAAVVIGGTSLFGGRGTILGTVFGTGIIAVLLTGLIVINVPPFWQEVAVGAVLIAAVYVDQLRGKRRAKA
ncbi:ABC transporter permease [Acidithrix ferrooxidans]|uniref:D-allose transport system permease protein AlsC n=1 Tax=Acidithrix ferrooxidans TaxID=1280514 RepID=A0A0D8HI46_9ACTN|nr:ABC transporter permease [Acidithrix ferrooxidans]KJF17432.1 D-allose transport system permease protein AlsC [Acidithrix ferrooxidans]